jgi:putative DeoR family transcriptional regulator (stage III sporulation protein D)
MGSDYGTKQERCVSLGKYIIDTQATVRDTASVYGISKSTVHQDVTARLEKVNPALYKEVKKVLEKNKQERHIRGGQATKQKYINASAAQKG